MTVLEIIKEPNSLLRKISSPVQEINDDIREFMYSMLETMYEEGGIGIAAIQVGNPIRALIVDLEKRFNNENTNDNENETENEIKNPYFIINPEIKEISEEKVILNEGCLSVRQADGISFIRGDVERPISITISYLDLEGKLQELAINGNDSHYDLWFARCLQHEIDHLNGVLFIDKLVEPILVAESEIDITGGLNPETEDL